MKVFSLYAKIVKKNFVSLIIYIIAFFGISLLFVSIPQNTATGFQEVQVPVVIENNDPDSELVEGLLTHLEKYVIIEEVDANYINDALYFREIHAVLTIPQNFTDDVLAGNNPQIEEQSIPGEDYTMLSINRVIDKYLHLTKLYYDYLDLSLTEIIDLVETDLAQEAIASRQTTETNTLGGVVNYYNYLSYLFFALIMSIIGIIMIRIKKKEVKQRMIISPYTQWKVNKELLFGHFIFSLGICLLMCGVSFLYFPQQMKTINGVFLMVNALCLCLAVLSLGYLISLLIKTENALPAIVNVVSLGSSFIAGAFVPQFLLGEEILLIAHILPNYYYVRNNEQIAYLSNLDWDNIKDIVANMGIQLLFAFVFMILAFIVSRKQMQVES